MNDSFRKYARKLLCLFLLLQTSQSQALTRPWIDGVSLNALGKKSGEIAIIDVKSGQKISYVTTMGYPGHYPPGSVAKLVTAYAGLKSGKISSATVFSCKNAITINGKIFHCTKPGGHGKLDLEHAIASSCNIWFYQASRKIGKTQIEKAWNHFGVSVMPGKYPVERLAVGEEGLKLTAIQMAGLARSLAAENSSEARILRQAMRKVVTEGTASELKDCKLAAAGKTGSPSHINDSSLRHGWFIGYAPAEKPKYAIAVFCYEGNAYKSAIPAAKKVINALADMR